LRTSDGGSGALVTARDKGGAEYRPDDVPLVTSFADQAALALELAEKQHTQQLLGLLADRDRIARDLHDHVIQRLFAAGLTLQATAGRVRDADVQQRLHQVVDQLDETVREIRTTIFDLHTRGSADHADSLRRQVLDVVSETAGDTVHATVRLSGPVDNLVTGDLAADVVAVVREGVSNAARHSGARHVVVTMDVTDHVVLEVRDDGRGIDATVARSGLRNVADRAAEWGGTSSVQRLDDGGTRLRWQAPLPAAASG